MTKKLLCAMLLCAALTLCLLTGTALAATREVNDAAQLSSAFDSANSGDTIKLTANIEDISNNFLYTSDAKNRTLDLNGHKITLADSYIYTCFIDHQGTGTLTVTDSRSGGSIELDTGNYRSIIEVNSPLDNPGDLIISGGTLKGSAPATLYMRNSQSDLTITGGTIMNDEAVPIFGKAKKVTMTGGSVIGKGRAINISADIEISGGTVAAEEDNGIAITGGSQGATLTLSGPCVIKGKGLAIANGITPIIGAGLTAKASVNYGGSPLVDYDATQLSTYKYIEILPIARIGDATISGITSMALTEQDVTLTLTGDTFVTSINPIGSAFDAASWFNALPAGISAMVTCTDTKTATITFSGTPTATSTEAMAITIPAASLTGGASITALANANAKWDIAAGVPPRIIAQPNHITVTVGQTATFSILADGHPAPTYQWQVNTGSGWQNVTDGTGGTTDTYTTPATTAIMSGYKYRCIASNGVSSDATSSEVVLLHPLHVEIVQDPASITAGEQVELRTVVSGGKPPYSYLWSTLATSPNIIVYPTATTTYTVTVVDSQPMPAHSNITVSMARAPVDPPASGNAITGITAGRALRRAMPRNSRRSAAARTS